VASAILEVPTVGWRTGWLSPRLFEEAGCSSPLGPTAHCSPSHRRRRASLRRAPPRLNAGQRRSSTFAARSAAPRRRARALLRPLGTPGTRATTPLLRGGRPARPDAGARRRRVIDETWLSPKEHCGCTARARSTSSSRPSQPPGHRPVRALVRPARPPQRPPARPPHRTTLCGDGRAMRICCRGPGYDERGGASGLRGDFNEAIRSSRPRRPGDEEAERGGTPPGPLPTRSAHRSRPGARRAGARVVRVSAPNPSMMTGPAPIPTSWGPNTVT